MARTKQNARKTTGGVKRKRDTEHNAPDLVSGEEQAQKKVTAADGVTTGAGRPEQTTYDKDIAKENPEQLAERFGKAIKKHKGDLSTIELEDESLPATAFKDTTNFEETRLVKNLGPYLEHNTERGEEELKEAAEDPGTPHTILLSSSAIRAQDILREVRKYGSQENKIAKLFAKHIKLKDAVSYVQQNRFGIGGGTAQRVEDLVKQEILKLDRLKRVVIDGSYVDDKQRTIFTDRDAFLSTLSLLNLEQLKLRLVSGKTEILVF